MAEPNGRRPDAQRLAARSGRARQLVVLLHGYGASGRDLIALGQQWQALFPDAAFVAPDAPEPCGQAPGGRQWFPLTFRDPDERWIGVNKAGPDLDAFLDAELARQGVEPGKLALVGFSQGTMMALHVGLRRARPLAAIVGFSGLLVGPDGSALQAPAATQPPPPVLLTHGSEDEVIPADAMFIAAETLAEGGVACQWHLSTGVGHGIDAAALTHAGLFLGQCLGLKGMVGPVATPPAGRR